MRTTLRTSAILFCGAQLMAAQSQPFIPENRSRYRAQHSAQPVEAIVSVVENPAERSTSTSNPAAVRYESVQIRGAKSLLDLETKLGHGGVEIAMRLNRLDRKHLGQAKSLVIPNSTASLLSLAPFPMEIEQAQSLPKLVLVSRRVQAFAAYEHGRLVRWGPTSTGKKSTPTPAGLFSMNWKSLETRSSINRDWRLPWYFNLDNHQGVALHQYDLPGYPASHGCVRLLEEDAQWFYSWGDQWIVSKSNRALLGYGTPVIIFGNYSYSEAPPWKRLPADPNAATLSTSEVLEALSPHLSVITARLQAREAAIASLVAERSSDRQRTALAEPSRDRIVAAP